MTTETTTPPAQDGITYAPSWAQATDSPDTAADTVAPEPARTTKYDLIVAASTPAWADVAKASQEAEREAKTESVLRLVSVPLTDADLAIKAHLGAQLVQEIKAGKAELRAFCGERRAALKQLEAEQEKLAEEVATGTGSVEVPCLRVPIWEQNAWRVVREDTGEEIGLEPMGADDRQLTIDDAIGEDEDALLDDDEPAELETRLDAALAEADAEGDITEPAAILDGAAEEPATTTKRGRKKRG